MSSLYSKESEANDVNVIKCFFILISKELQINRSNEYKLSYYLYYRRFVFFKVSV